MRHAENIVKFRAFTDGRFPLNRFGNIEVEQKLLTYRLSNFIAGNRNHSVSDNRTVFGNRNVGSAGSDIDEHQI